MKLRKVLSVLLVGSVILAGCSDSNNTSKTQPAAASAESQNPGTTNSDVEERERVGNVYKEGMPIVKDPIKLKIAYLKRSGDKIDAAEKEYVKKLVEETNINIEWIAIPQTGLSEKVNLMLASGDLPDVFLSNVITPQDLSAHHSSGMFVPLNSYVADWAPNINRILEENPDARSYLTMQDGNMYALAAGQMAPWLFYNNIYIINEQWLKNLELDKPTTTEEYYQVLKAFKEQDANGNGNPNDEIPLSLSGMGSFRHFGQAFGLPMNEDYLVVKEKQISFGPASDRFREMADYLHKLYAEGLIDQESLAQDVNQLSAKGKNEAAPLLGSLVTFLHTSIVGDWSDQYTFIEPLEGPHGDREVLRNVLKPQIGAVITNNNKNIEATLRLFDYMNTDLKHQLEARYGLESSGIFTYLDNGQFTINSNKAPNGITYQEWWDSYSMNESFPVYQNSQLVAEKRVLEGIDINASIKLAMDNVYHEFAAEGQFPAIIPPKELQENISMLKTDLMSLTDNFLSQAVIQGTTNDSWNKFQSDVRKAKYEQFVTLQQELYDLANQ